MGYLKKEHRGRNLEVRKKIEENIQSKGKEKMFERLRKIDPMSASRIHINDVRRLVRALEVFEIYGKPISQLQPNREGLWDKYNVRIFMLNRDRDKLYDRINKRVDKMFKAGALKEIKKIKQKKISQTARGIIGLKETFTFLGGGHDLEKIKESIKKEYSQFC